MVLLMRQILYEPKKFQSIKKTEALRKYETFMSNSRLASDQINDQSNYFVVNYAEILEGSSHFFNPYYNIDELISDSIVDKSQKDKLERIDMNRENRNIQNIANKLKNSETDWDQFKINKEVVESKIIVSN